MHEQEWGNVLLDGQRGKGESYRRNASRRQTPYPNSVLLSATLSYQCLLDAHSLFLVDQQVTRELTTGTKIALANFTTVPLAFALDLPSRFIQ
jgi:hypothetical protein